MSDLPVTTQQIPPALALSNYDGSPAEILEFGCVKRQIVGLSGNRQFQYLDPNFFVIPDFRKYIKARRELDLRQSARQVQNEYNRLEAPSQQTAETVEPRIDGNVILEKQIDKEIDRALSTGDMIKLDEAFPDVGLYGEEGNSLPTAPSVRARQAALHGSRYQREYILRTVHRLTLRRVPVDQIAQMFNVQVVTVYNWIDELKARIKAEASTMTITQIAGDTLSFYNEARAMGLTIASTAEKTSERVRGMEVALKAEQDKHKFLQVAGFYDTAKLGRETMEDDAAKKARSIINMTKNLLSGKFEQDKTEQDISDQIDTTDKVIL